MNAILGPFRICFDEYEIDIKEGFKVDAVHLTYKVEVETSHSGIKGLIYVPVSAIGYFDGNQVLSSDNGWKIRFSPVLSELSPISVEVLPVKETLVFS